MEEQIPAQIYFPPNYEATTDVESVYDYTVAQDIDNEATTDVESVYDYTVAQDIDDEATTYDQSIDSDGYDMSYAEENYNSYDQNYSNYNESYETYYDPTQTDSVYMADGTEKWVPDYYFWNHYYADNYVYDRNNGYWVQAAFTDTWYGSYAGVTSTSEYESLYNIDLACQYLNNQVLQAHSEFVWSDWERMGPNNETQGYLSGAILIDGYVGESYPTAPGGGVCVVSSVLFNAALNAGCIPLENHNHTVSGIPVDMTYSPIGRQASVSYGTWDCIFFNPSDRDLKISAYFDWTNQECVVSVTPLN